MARIFELPLEPSDGDRPTRFVSPFAASGPHPWALRAAEVLLDELRRGVLAPDLDFDAPGGGKMFGVLVVADECGRIGYLRGFSGMLGGVWVRDGFVPPLVDTRALEDARSTGETELRALNRQYEALERGPEVQALRAEASALAARHRVARGELDDLQKARRAQRHEARRRLLAHAADDETRTRALFALDQESRTDRADRRRLLACQAEESSALSEALRARDEERVELGRLRAERSRMLLEALQDGYVVTSARGERRSLRALFAPQTPPGGAGDCAAPKLLAFAFRRGLEPLALAEVWWGAPPLTGGRRSGGYYPPCRGKCGPILAFMFEGLETDPAPLFGSDPISPEEPRTIYEDEWLVVVDKPCGLLSVPGRSARLSDSVLTRLARRYRSSPMLVHRLDLDTSGLLLAALDRETYVELQRQFLHREVEKRYVALLDGDVVSDGGRVELALRVDLDDRPRQIHDPVHGRSALTEWRVVERAGATTRVVLRPLTGRTHQLRVHAAHPLGIHAPIVGDRLYGRPAERLMLHAEALGFVHPRTKASLVFESPAPF